MRTMGILSLLVITGMVGLVSLPEKVSAQSYSCRSRTYYAPSYSYASYSYPSYSYAAPTYSYQAPAYKEEVRIKEIVIPSYLQIPLYGAYYQPPVNVPALNVQPVMPSSSPTTVPGTSPAMPTNGIPNPSAMPGKAPCADVNARVDQLEGKLNLILQAIQGKETLKPPTPLPDKAKTPPIPPPPPTKEKEKDDDVEKVAFLGARQSCAMCHDRSNADKMGKKGTTLGGGFIMTDGDKFAPISDRQWVKILGKLSIKQMPPERDQDGNPVKDLTEQQYAALNVLALRKSN